MRMPSVRSGLVLPMIAMLALPLSAGAQELPLFTWTGRVDREVTLTMRGSSLSSSASRGEDYRGRFTMGNALPAEDGMVRVAVTGGRGEVSVVEQPSARNNYATVIRMVDRGSGADRYQVTAFFSPANGGRYDRGALGRYGENPNEPNRGYGRGRGQMQPMVLHWVGRVDADAEVRWNGRRVNQRALNGASLRNVRASVTGGRRGDMMNRGGQLTINKIEGRGDVSIVEQPNQGNNWTAVIHINDPQGGYGRYNFDVIWQ